MSMNVKGANRFSAGLQIGMVKKDLGATFANGEAEFVALGIDSEPAFAVMENTNGTGPGVRLYVKANGKVSYVVLS